MGAFLFVVGILLSATLASYLVYYYADWKLISWKYLVLTWLGWWFSIGIVFVIPLDVACTSYDTCRLQFPTQPEMCIQPWFYLSSEFRIAVWNILYWTTYVLCWTGYPILQSYSTAGDFSAMERLRTSIKENLIFYMIAGTVGLIFLIWIAVRSEGFSGVIGVAIAAANAWGLFLLISFLGYGLVEIPKRMWRKGDRSGHLRYNQFLIVGMHEAFEDARQELDTTLKLVKKCSEKIDERDPFRPFVNQIIEKCPPAYRDVLYGEGDFNFSYDELVQLNYRVGTATQEYRRTRVLYDEKLNEIYEAEDVLEAKSSSSKIIEWSFRKPRTFKLHEQYDRVEKVWKVYLESPFYRLLALFTAIFSIIVIWSELVFNFSDQFDLSIFSLVINSVDQNYNLQWLLVFCSVSYIALSAYWSLLQLKLFNFFRLIPHQQSDAYSLLFSAAYLCRLIAPLAFNFLLMIQDGASKDSFCSNPNNGNTTTTSMAFFDGHQNHFFAQGVERMWFQETENGTDITTCMRATTAFNTVLGNIELAPFLGTQFIYYFPALLIILVFFNAFNLYQKIVGTCCPFERCRKYVFLDEMSEETIYQGKEIVMRERDARKRGIHKTKRDKREKAPVLPAMWEKIRSLFRKEEKQYGLLYDEDL